MKIVTRLAVLFFVTTAIALPTALDFSPVSAQVVWPEAWNQRITVNSAIGIDLDSNAIMFARDADKIIAPASMAKMMTLYIIFDRINSGSLSLSDTIDVSTKAWRMGGSRMFLEPGVKVSVRDIIMGIVVSSGNDAAVAVAEHLAFTEDTFVEIMNAKAQQIGMTNTNFTNASGWPDPDQYTTVNDIAILARHTLEDFPTLVNFYKERSYTHNDITQYNRNLLLRNSAQGVVGLKTGHTEESGYSLALAANHQGRRVVIVFSGTESIEDRSNTGAFLLTQALERWHNVTLFDAQESIVDIPIAAGVNPTIAAITEESVLLTLPKSGLASSQPHVTAEIIAWKQAPITKGDKLGVLNVRAGDQSHEVILRAKDSVARAGYFERAWLGLEAKATQMWNQQDDGHSLDTPPVTNSPVTNLPVAEPRLAEPS